MNEWICVFNYIMESFQTTALMSVNHHIDVVSLWLYNIHDNTHTSWCDHSWCDMSEHTSMKNISDNADIYMVVPERNIWCELADHPCVKNVSDNTHTDMVALWCEFWCDFVDGTLLRDISDNTHTYIVSLSYEFWCVSWD